MPLPLTIHCCKRGSKEDQNRVNNNEYKYSSNRGTSHCIPKGAGFDVVVVGGVVGGGGGGVVVVGGGGAIMAMLYFTFNYFRGVLNTVLLDGRRQKQISCPSHPLVRHSLVWITIA